MRQFLVIVICVICTAKYEMFFFLNLYTSWGLYEHLDISMTYKIASSTKFQQIHIFLSRLDIPATFFNVQCSMFGIFSGCWISLSMYIKNVHFSIPLRSVFCLSRKKEMISELMRTIQKFSVQCRDNTFNHIAVIILYAQGTQSVE